MPPSIQVELAPEQKFQDAPRVKSFQTTIAIPMPIPSAPGAAPAIRHRIIEGSFQSSMIEMNRMNSGSKFFDILISLTMNVAVLAAPIVAGLYFTDTINLRQFESTFLVAPPPPPPPPPAPAVMAAKAPPTRRVFEHAGKLLAPTAIPKNVAEIKEAPLPADVDGAGGILGGVPGGVAGGSMGGVIGGVIGGANTKIAAPPAPKEIKSKAPVRLGGRVRAPRLIHRVDPTYPPLARQTHTEGTVVIEAILDETGNVVEMKVISGHGLLIPAAIEAVRQWKYEPTYLNDQPVAVQMNINVTFTLAQ
jgi:protein TonB